MAKTQRFKRRKSTEEGSLSEPGGALEQEPQTGDTLLTETPPEEQVRTSLRDRLPFVLIQSAHPRQAIITAAFVGGCAAISGRPTREYAVVFATVLVGQAILGWHNDLVDRQRDASHDTPGKPISQDRLDPGNAWFALICAVLLVIPLSISSGITAGSAYLLSLVVALLGNVVLRRGLLSFLPWAASYALIPAYLSYGGWGGAAEGQAPQVLMTVLFGLLGVGVHFLRAIWGLVADNEDGWTYLPLRLGLRLGATRLLVLSGIYTSLVLVAIVFAATYSGLRQ